MYSASIAALTAINLQPYFLKTKLDVKVVQQVNIEKLLGMQWY